MKLSCRLLILAISIFAMVSCSAQRRAQRRVRRAVEQCPELVQMKAHTFDTVLSVSGFADCTVIPLADVMSSDTIYAATDHGTVVVSLRRADSALRVGFVAAPTEYHYQDTINYAQVVVEPEPEKGVGGFWNGFAILIFGLGLGAALCFYLLIKR